MHRLLPSLLILSLAACGGSSLVGSRYVKSQQVSAALGGTVTVSAAEDSRLANASITFPPGALAADTVITVELGLDDLSAGRAGPVLVLGPEGLALAKDAEVVLPLSLDARQRSQDLFVIARGDDGDSRFSGSALVADDSRSRVRFPVSKLRAFQGVVAATASGGGVTACTSDDVCAPNQDCVQGACTWSSSPSGASCVTDDTCPWDHDCVASQCVPSSSSSDGGVDDHGGR